MSRVGQSLLDSRRRSADLTRLHSLMGHYGRMLADLQRTRIANGNRLAAMERDGIEAEFMLPITEVAEGLKAQERLAERALRRAAREHPLASWIDAQRGISLGGFGRLMAITGSLDRFPTVAKLWKYLGLAVVGGRADKMHKGEVGSYSPRGKTLCNQIGMAIVRVGQGGKYRAEYDRMKAHYEEERPDWPQIRRHAAAQRYAVKCLVRDMWIEWHHQACGAQMSNVPLDSAA